MAGAGAAAGAHRFAAGQWVLYGGKNSLGKIVALLAPSEEDADAEPLYSVKWDARPSPEDVSEDKLAPAPYGRRSSSARARATATAR